MLETLLFALQVTGPIVIAISAGVLLKSVGLLPDRLISLGSAMVFYISLPLLMFTSVLRQPFADALKPDLVILGVFITLVVFYLGHLLSRHARLRSMPDMRAVVVQASFRGNLGIVGLSLCLNAYGTDALADVSVLMAMLTITYNVLSVWLFVRTDGKPGSTSSYWQITLQMLKNPLITSILAGLLLGVFWSPSQSIVTFADTFVAWTLPTALLCIGGSLTLQSAQDNRWILFSVSVIKLFIMPTLALALSLLLGLPAREAGMLFLLSASPVAAASYVMVRAYCAESSPGVPLAANLVVVTTLLSMLTVTLGVFVLRTLQII